MKSLSRYFRLLPAVILIAAGLLVLKSVAIVQDARAQTALTGQAPAPEPQDTTQVAVADPAFDDSASNSAAEVDVLTSLSKRRQQLDSREQSLDMQANLIAAAEQRVDGKIEALKQLQAQMQTLLGQRDAADQAQLNALVKSYSSMKPADAARIFNSLDGTVELNVAALMKSDVLGAVLSKMEPAAAQKLTVRLANRLKLPEATPAAIAAATAPQPSIAQTAALDPSAVLAPTTPGAPPAPTTPASTTPAPQAASTTPAPNPAPTTPAPQPATPSKQAATTPASSTATPTKQQAAATPASNTAKAPTSAPANTPAPNAPKQAAVNTPPKPAAPSAAPPAKPKGA